MTAAGHGERISYGLLRTLSLSISHHLPSSRGHLSAAGTPVFPAVPAVSSTKLQSKMASLRYNVGGNISGCFFLFKSFSFSGFSSVGN